MRQLHGDYINHSTGLWYYCKRQNSSLALHGNVEVYCVCLILLQRKERLWMYMLFTFSRFLCINNSYAGNIFHVFTFDESRVSTKILNLCHMFNVTHVDYRCQMHYKTQRHMWTHNACVYDLMSAHYVGICLLPLQHTVTLVMWPGLPKSTMWARIRLSCIFANILSPECSNLFCKLQKKVD